MYLSCESQHDTYDVGAPTSFWVEYKMRSEVFIDSLGYKTSLKPSFCLGNDINAASFSQQDLSDTSKFLW